MLYSIQVAVGERDRSDVFVVGVDEVRCKGIKVGRSRVPSELDISEACTEPFKSGQKGTKRRTNS